MPSPTSLRKKTGLPRYDDRRRRWIGGDSRTLYLFTGLRTGGVGVYPGGGAGKHLLMNWGPEATVRVATRAEAEEHWQSPLHVGWKVTEAGVHHATKKYGPKTAAKVEQTMHEFKRGKLKSGSGGKVTSRKQAIAIGLSQARSKGYKVPPSPTGHATMKASLDDRVRAHLSNMRPGQEIDASGMARAIGGADPLGVAYALERAAKAGLAVSGDGRWFGPAHKASHAHHATRKSPTQLDREIAEFTAKPQLGDPKWEREWSELLTEKHSKARMPTSDDLARALRYVENEYVIKDGRIDMEQWAEGLAFGRYAGDAEDKRLARTMLDQVSAATWLRAAERANYLACEQGEAPRYLS